MAGAKLTMKNPGSPMQRMFGADPSSGSGALPASSDSTDSPDDESGESYDVTTDELNTCLTDGTVKTASGCTLNKVDSPDAAASGAPPSTPPPPAM